MCNTGPYSMYYYIPWPDSQGFLDIDPDWQHLSFGPEAGIFAEKEWVDKINMGDGTVLSR